MKIKIARKGGEISGEHTYNPYSVGRNIVISNKIREGGSQHTGITRDTAYGSKPALLPRGLVKSDEQKALVPIRSYIATKDSDIIFLHKEIDWKDAFGNEKTIFFLNISTEVVKDQYAIGKVVLDVPDQRAMRYREVQAYRLMPGPTLETYI